MTSQPTTDSPGPGNLRVTVNWGGRKSHGLQGDSMFGRGKGSALPALGLLGMGHMLLPGKLATPASRQALWCQRERDRILSTEHIRGKKISGRAATQKSKGLGTKASLLRSQLQLGFWGL